MFDGWRRGGREVAVIGLGQSGTAAARLLRRHGVVVYASDRGRGPGLEAAAAELRPLGVPVDLGGHDLARIGRAAAAVVSPGVPPDAPAIQAAHAAGLAVRAELDLALEALEGTPYLAVTGTNGKTTTTALIAHLLRAAGLDAEAAGNIGLPASAVALRERPPAWLVLEVSSFQLHDCPRLAPRAGVLTNLSPDHLDRYPTLDAYYEDKRRLFRNAGPASVWVWNADDPASRHLVAGTPGRHLSFSTSARAEGWLDRERGLLILGKHPLLPRAELALLGDHNVANALAAVLAVSAATGPEPGALAAGLRTFAALPHRLEPIREVNGVLWVNDSKATNLASTEVAIAAQVRPFVLLLGGRHKGEPYGRLGPLLTSRCRAVIAYGEARPLIAADLAGLVTPVEGDDPFALAVACAAGLARPGDAVLLSPACSSYDLFPNYEARGARFRRLVEAL